MNKQGWLTRSGDTVGGEGQDAASLVRPNQPATTHLQPAALHNETDRPAELQTEPAS